MSQLEYIKNENKKHSEIFKDGNLPLPPSRKIAVLACMDARLLVDQVLGLKIGEAHIIRNAGGIATDDAIRSLIISHELLGTKEIIVVNHTNCSMVTFKDEDLQKIISEKYNNDTTNIRFHAFESVEDNVKNQIKHIRSVPFLSEIISVSGFIYDVSTGNITQVS
ncbi:beta-class carbonic anhydrase [Candidatus Nitrosocosmicus agrestis]|jgi:carbonic anhydrase|uniref:beta-class carbonic anhydrase n=1 Tax=Candidatus Nitrosocosmicus agrestis TaxID=2563600 RepID=UPI00122E1041|nr:carbonic anhydrase [Candidatus Nitrosocosmicus sp. SS]KAA2279836.1 carbonic anhydrase [Candidatus Nitrosocosmicus sp. SS]KAF0870364.1 carbonic anhydrase [Candidatus Nitrosocosmicus sp. SS]